MIRSEAVPQHDWKRVPVGFRVKRAGDGAHTPCAITRSLRSRTHSGAGDLLRIGAAAAVWGTRDALRTRPERRVRVLRLTMA
jgi:hypothetical protein